MKKQYRKLNPSPAVRAPAEHKVFIKRSRPVRAFILKKTNPKLENEKNLMDLYEENLLELQNNREWSDSVCRQYDRVMVQSLAPLVEGYTVVDMTLDDYLDIWDRFMQTKPSKSKEDKAYMLIRYLAELARKLGLSSVYFYSYSELSHSPQYQRKKKIKTTSAESVDYELRGLRIARSLSLEAELRFLLAVIDRIKCEGEFIAGLLMFLCGLRTSEACGVLFKDLVEVAPGYWGIMRRTARDPGNGSIELRAKTKNGYRILPIPRFLAAILLERLERLKEMYPDKNVENWPVACRGTEYSVGADQKRVNDKLQTLYHETGCDEDLMALAMYDFRSEDEIRDECESSLVAYLGRHQMITELVAVGMPERYIYALAGHAQRDYAADPADLTNPDIFIEVSNYLNMRPIIWLLDSSMETMHIDVTPNTQIKASCDGDAELVFCTGDQSRIPFIITATEIERADPIKIDTNGEITYKVYSGPAVHYGDAPLCMTPRFREMADILREADDEHERIADQDDCPDGFHFKVIDQEPVPSLELPRRPAFRKKPVQNKKQPEEKPASVAGISLYALDSLGKASLIGKENLVISRRDTVGKKVQQSNKSIIQAVLPYAAAQQNYVITKSGMAYSVPGIERLDAVLADSKYENLLQALELGAILLPCPNNRDAYSHGKLVLLTNLGNMICMSDEWLHKIRKNGIPFAKDLSEKEVIVSACLLDTDQDLLILTRNGKALRLYADSIHMVKAKGTKPRKGIRLSEDDSAVTCLPYTEDLIIAKENGQIAAINRPITPVATCGSYGINLTEGSKVITAFRRPDAIVLVDSRGYMIIVDAEEFVSKKKTIGVNAKKLSRDSKLIFASGISYSEEQ